LHGESDILEEIINRHRRFATRHYVS